MRIICFQVPRGMSSYEKGKVNQRDDPWLVRKTFPRIPYRYCACARAMGMCAVVVSLLICTTLCLPLREGGMEGVVDTGIVIGLWLCFFFRHGLFWPSSEVWGVSWFIMVLPCLALPLLLVLLACLFMLCGMIYRSLILCFRRTSTGAPASCPVCYRSVTLRMGES